MTKTRIAAIVVNPEGALLPYTVEGTKDQCEEKMCERMGEAWERLKGLGARVAQCEIVLLD